MNLSQLKQFQTVASTENFTKAAQVLYIAQPSLSQSIMRLEDELGIKLFNRSEGRIWLNQYGKEFLEYVDDALLKLNNGVEHIQNLANSKKKILRIADAGHSFLSANLVMDFSLLNPDIKLLHLQCKRNQIAYYLTEDIVDCVLTTTAPSHLYIEWKKIGEIELQLSISNNLNITVQNNITLSKLKNEIFIGTLPGYETRDIFDSLCELEEVSPKFIYEGADNGTIAALANMGRGISFFTNIAGGKDKHEFNVNLISNIIRINSIHNLYSFGIAYKRDNPIVETSMKFLTHIQKLF